MPVSNSYELEFGSLLMGGNTDYGFVKAEGLKDRPEIRTSDRTRLRQHGMLPGDDFVGGRSVVIDLEINGDDSTIFETNVQAFDLALQPGNPEGILKFKIPGVAGGGIRRMNVRPRKIALPVESSFYYRLPVASVEFFATDPRIYDDTQQSPSVGIAASVSGHAWNNTWNLNWGGASTSNIVQATNVGTFPAPCVIRFNGPVTNPQIENVTQGKSLKLTADGGLVLGVGEFVELDTNTRTILLGGTSSRYSKLSSDSRWFDLAPGINELRFTGSTSGSPTMQVTYRSAWL